MPLIALLVALLLAGLAIGRMGGTLSPQPGATSPPAPTTRGVERATEAASQAERQRLDEAMKALR